MEGIREWGLCSEKDEECIFIYDKFTDHKIETSEIIERLLWFRVDLFSTYSGVFREADEVYLVLN